MHTTQQHQQLLNFFFRNLLNLLHIRELLLHSLPQIVHDRAHFDLGRYLLTLNLLQRAYSQRLPRVDAGVEHGIMLVLQIGQVLPLQDVEVVPLQLMLARLLRPGHAQIRVQPVHPRVDNCSLSLPRQFLDFHRAISSGFSCLEFLTLHSPRNPVSSVQHEWALQVQLAQQAPTLVTDDTI